MNVIEFDKVSKQYHKKEYFFGTADLFWALRDVSFSVNAGETLGIIGSNGAGKTTMMKLMAEIAYPTGGRVQVNGRVIPLISMEGCLDPLLNGHENVSLFLSFFRTPQKERRLIKDQIVEFSGLAGFMEMPLKNYSSGMWSRLSFSIAAHVPCDILLIDEVLAVGDQEFQQKCFGKIKQFQQEGKTIVFVSHDLEDVERISNRVIWLEEGRIRKEGPPHDIKRAYLDTHSQRSEA